MTVARVHPVHSTNVEQRPNLLPTNQSINQSIFIRQCNFTSRPKQKEEMWMAARTGNSPTKLASGHLKTDRHTDVDVGKPNMMQIHIATQKEI